MVEEQARTRAGFDALPGPFPLEPPFLSAWEASPPLNPFQAPPPGEALALPLPDISPPAISLSSA